VNKQIHNKPRIARFRRWSRAAYAVFASLSLAVSIGVLSVSVSEKSTQKSDRFVVKAAICTREGIEEELEDDLFLYNDPTELQTGNVLVNQITNNAAACCFAYLYNQSLNG
jgi:hypothetical protein